MTNPFVTERANYDLSLLEREYRKRPENVWIQQNLPKTQCINVQVDNAKTFSDLGTFLGTFDLSLLAQLSAFKAMSVSPANFTDFLGYLDQTISYFSCIFSANLDTINNKSPSDKSFDWGAFALTISFDFLKAYGIGLFKLLERIAVEIIKKVFLEILDIVDCNKINKCIVPCEPNQNPYQKLFVKPLIKESTNTGIFFAQKVIDGKFSEKGFDINGTDIKDYSNKVISRLMPDELECLLKGFKSTAVYQFLIDLFKDHTGHDVTTGDIDTLFQDIAVVVDLVPYTPVGIENNPCGLISMEAVARMRLRQQGLSEQQITDRMNLVIQESQGKLQTITDFLRNLPSSPPDLDNVNILDENGNTIANGNAPIVSAVINTSLDLIFNSIGYNQQAVQSILDTILVHPLGEICLAYYWTNWGSAGEAAIPRSLPIDQFEEGNSIDEIISQETVTLGDYSLTNPLSNSTFSALLAKINQQINKNDFNLISFVLDSLVVGGSERFYDKYNLQTKAKFKGYSINYEENGDINITSNNVKKFSIKHSYFTDIENNVVTNIVYEDIDVNYLSLVNRNDISEVLRTYNSPKLFSENITVLENEPERIFKDIYDNIFSYMEQSMSTEFFFQEFFRLPGDSLHKEDFSKIDYFNVEEIIQNIKEKINA